MSGAPPPVPPLTLEAVLRRGPGDRVTAGWRHGTRWLIVTVRVPNCPVPRHGIEILARAPGAYA